MIIPEGNLRRHAVEIPDSLYRIGSGRLRIPRMRIVLRGILVVVSQTTLAVMCMRIGTKTIVLGPHEIIS